VQCIQGVLPGCEADDDDDDDYDDSTTGFVTKRLIAFASNTRKAFSRLCTKKSCTMYITHNKEGATM
jgi:hypothetical protein